MDSIELKRIERRLRLRYEWSRTVRALVGFAPSLLIVLVAAWFARRPSSAAAFGAAMFAAGAVLLWYGRDLRRAVLPGLLAGIAPLSLTLCATSVGHECMGGSCVSLCIPACFAGGLVAGLAVSAVGYRGGYRTGFWLSASAIALLTGAMGCVCVGSSGLVGLAIGFGAGMVPAAAQAVFGRNSA
jgi:hypothetical protein